MTKQNKTIQLLFHFIIRAQTPNPQGRLQENDQGGMINVTWRVNNAKRNIVRLRGVKSVVR